LETSQVGGIFIVAHSIYAIIGNMIIIGFWLVHLSGTSELGMVENAKMTQNVRTTTYV
jgi:hypothetical protein